MKGDLSVLDFHSHILPNIDDGSQSTDESIAMLKMLKKQGVDTVALTSHYLAMDESPQMFIDRRTQAYDTLKAEIEKTDEQLPKLLLGAEVYYYPGICKMEELGLLTLENSNLLLLEMPMAPWGVFTTRELTELAESSNIQVVIAHIERSLKYQKKETINRLLDCGIMFQVNSSFFNTMSTRRKALKMLKYGQIHFIGSDCHNIEYRPPRIGEATTIIENKLGKDILDELDEMQKSYFNT